MSDDEPLDTDFLIVWSRNRQREGTPHAGPWSSIDVCQFCRHAWHGLRCTGLGSCKCSSSVPEEAR